jgi:hypothetical protein
VKAFEALNQIYHHNVQAKAQGVEALKTDNSAGKAAHAETMEKQAKAEDVGAEKD